MKKITVLFSMTALMVIGSITSCGKPSFEERLKKLDGVTDVKKIEYIPVIEGAEACKEAYTFNIKQPIDWNNKELGTFNQKVNVYYNSDNSITEFTCGGYAIFTEKPSRYYKSELQERYTGNVVSIEYRFFADSRPEGFSYNGTKYASYLNSYQASKDFHNIITQMKKIFTGKTIFNGASKGGYTTEMMCYYYPDDIDSYISYVAPLCNSEYDDRFCNYVFTSIGDVTYGKEKAQEYRDILFKFQENALKDENNFRDKITKKLNITKINEVEVNEVYDVTISEFAIGIWQYKGPTEFEEIDSINKMSESSEAEIEAKATAMARIIQDNNPEIDKNYLDPYYIQAKTEMGNYSVDLSYLRDIKKFNIKTTKERDKFVNDHLLYTNEQLNEFKYTPVYRNALIDFYNTTKKDIVKIVGYSDPWYSVKAPVTTNSHIHLFEVKNNHTSEIKMLEESKKNEAFGIIDKLLGVSK